MRNILLVEDNLGDAQLIKLLLKDSRVTNHVEHIIDGKSALDYVFQRGAKYSSATRPDLIVMDLNLPKLDGRQLLREIKTSPKLRQIPIIIFTSSSAEEDIQGSYDGGANCFLVKPMGLDELDILIKKNRRFLAG